MPNIRLEYRYQTLLAELELIRGKRKEIFENMDSYIEDGVIVLDGTAAKGTTGH